MCLYLYTEFASLMGLYFQKMSYPSFNIYKKYIIYSDELNFSQKNAD